MKKGWIGVALFLLTFCSLFLSVEGIGITWDEPIYINYILYQSKWLLSPHPFSRDAILRFWPAQAHPPFVQYLLSPSILLLSRFFDPLTSARIGTIIISSLLIVAIFWIVSQFYGKIVGLFCSLSLLFIPRLWGHFHLVSLDVPLMLIVLLASYSFMRGINSWRWSIISGILWGFALSTKATSLLFIPPLLIWAHIYHRKEYGNNVISLFFISPAIFFILWPGMWIETAKHFLQFVSFQVIRMTIPVYYFGTTFTEGMPTPWHYPLLMFAVTIPVSTLIFIFIGTGRLIKEKFQDEFGALCFILSVFFLLGVCSPFYSKYDGIRLFIAVLPFLVCLGGKGLSWIQQKIEKSLPARKKAFIFYTILFISIFPGLLDIIRTHPFYLAHYNILIGGIKGAQNRGMETTYWGDTINNRVIQFINKKVKVGAKVGIYPVGSLQTKYLQAFMRDDITLDSSYSAETDYLILHCRQGMFKEELWNIYNSAKPIFVQSVNSVPLVKVYEKDEILPFLSRKSD
ncbi:MAG TPA: hypothetical protein EYP78_04300 [Candidatus Omnitrophica bacterium]|nr:hypothetical protein [Candidatus Omnitrophota bacterium]